MIGIEAIGSYVPADRLDNLSRLAELDTDEFFIREKIGFERLARKRKDEETSDLCVRAYQDLCTRITFPAEEIECIALCTQNPDNMGLPHTSAIVQHKLQLPCHVAAFDISLGCSGYVYGLSILSSFMRENEYKRGLLFTADPYSKILDHADRNTELLFGDAATCTMLTDRPRFMVLKSVFATDGSGAAYISRQGGNGKLIMNGQKVFMFAMKCVPQQVASCLQKNNLSLDQVDLFLFHQGSKYIVENIRRRMRLPEGKVPFTGADIGNTVSSTIPLSLQDRLDSRYQTIIISGFGVGLSWATTVLSKV